MKQNRTKWMIALASLVFVVATHAKTEDPTKAQIKKLEGQRREVDMKLAKIRQRIEKTPAMKAEQDRRSNAWRAMRERQEKANELVRPRQASQGAYAAYRKVVDGKMAGNSKVAALEKKKAALADKQAAVEMEKARAELEMRHRSSTIQRALAADKKLQDLRTAARGKERDSREAKAYQDARKAKFEANPDTKKFMKVVEQKNETISGIRNEIREVWGAIGEIRREIERGEDPAVVAARKRSWDASKAYRDVCKKVLAPEEKALADAGQAFRKKSTELLQRDREARPLLTQRANIEKQIQDIRNREKEAKRKKHEKKQPAKKPAKK